MVNYTAFLFLDAGTGRTHLLGWDPLVKEWLMPCGLVKQLTSGQVTYSPDKPLCRNCSNLTRYPSPAPRTRHP